MHFSFSLKYVEETSEELPNFSIGIDPTSRKNKAELKTRKLRVSQICRSGPAPANFGRKKFTGNRTDTNWSSITFKGKFSGFFYYALCSLRTIRLKQENFSRNSNTNYTRRHKFITHKNNCCQVFSRSRNDQPMFVNEYKFQEG